MIKKTILEGAQAREKLLKGGLTVSRILGQTLGPAGRNVMIQKAYSAPEITNDGGTVARHIVLEDEIEDLGAQTVVEATMKTNDRGGDGRSTTAVIAGKIIEDCAKKIDAEDKDSSSQILGVEGGADVIGMSRKILESKEIVIEKLKKSARPLKKGELKHVVSTSIGKIYPEYAESITEMVETVGKDGYVSVEDNWGTKYGVETTTIQGMRFLGSYASPVMITDINKKEAVFEDCNIFVTNHRIENASLVIDLIKQVRDTGKRKFIIICEGYEREFLAAVIGAYVKAAQGKTDDAMFVLAIKAPSLTTDQFEDVSTFVGAKFFDKNKGDTNLTRATLAHCGYAKKIIVDEDDTIITGGKGDVSGRLDILNKQLDIEKDSAFKEQLKRRIGALNSGFGIIRVGASTEGERIYVKKKIEDSVNAAKAAMEEGVVRGGGLALKEIAEELGVDNILYNALIEPYKKIRANVGGEIKVPPTVLDALKVTRLAVENACSVASGLITCEVAIADRRKTLWDELDRKIAPRDNEDFRDDENQELKYRT